MFRGPSFIVSTMQEETTPIFKRLWYDWTQQQPGIEPTNPLGQCWVPPIVAFYDQQGLLRTYSLPGGSIRSPHPGSPRGGRPYRRLYTRHQGHCRIYPIHQRPIEALSARPHTIFLLNKSFWLQWFPSHKANLGDWEIMS